MSTKPSPHLQNSNISKYYKPFSYTHLDVYKRQCEDTADEKRTGRPTSTSDENVEKVKDFALSNCRINIRKTACGSSYIVRVMRSNFY